MLSEGKLTKHSGWHCAFCSDVGSAAQAVLPSSRTLLCKHSRAKLWWTGENEQLQQRHMGKAGTCGLALLLVKGALLEHPLKENMAH